MSCHNVVYPTAKNMEGQFGQSGLIIALPVAPKDTDQLELVEVVTSPSSHFRGVAQYYQDFTRQRMSKSKSILQTKYSQQELE